MNEPSNQRTYWRCQLLCDVLYSTIEELWELVYCYVTNLTEQRYCQLEWKQIEIPVTQTPNGLFSQNKSYDEPE